VVVATHQLSRDLPAPIAAAPDLQALGKQGVVMALLKSLGGSDRRTATGPQR